MKDYLLPDEQWRADQHLIRRTHAMNAAAAVVVLASVALIARCLG